MLNAEQWQLASKSIAENNFPRYFLNVSIAEKIFKKTQTLPEATQETILHFVEKLAENPTPEKPSPKAGSAKGLIHIGPDFNEQLEDFKPYME